MQDGGEPVCGMSSYRQPRYLRLSLETGGFASPPRGGFAYSTNQRSNTSAENNAINTDLSSNTQLVATRGRRPLATVNLAMSNRRDALIVSRLDLRFCGRRGFARLLDPENAH